MSFKKNLKKSLVLGALMTFVITGNAYAGSFMGINYDFTDGKLTSLGYGDFNYNLTSGTITVGDTTVKVDQIDDLVSNSGKYSDLLNDYNEIMTKIDEYGGIEELIEQAATSEEAAAALNKIKKDLGVTNDADLATAVENAKKYAALLESVGSMEGLAGTTSAEKLASLIENATKNTEQLVQLNENLGELVEFTNNVENAATTVANKIQEGVDYLKENEGAIQQSIADQVAAAKAEIQKNAEAIKTEIKDDVAALKASVEKNEEYVKNEIVANQNAIKKAVEDNQKALADAVRDNDKKVADAVAAAVKKLETGIQNGVGAEAMDRIEADAKLDAKIDAETERAQAEEARIEGKVDAETERAKAEEARIEGKVDAETERAQAEEARIEGKVNTETERAKAAEKAIVEEMNSQVNRLDNRIDRVDAKIDKVGAMAAAMASLKTMGYDPEAPTEIAVGIGQYRNETGLAIGAFHYPNKDFMLNFSLSTSSDEVMGGVGATWKIGRKKPEGNPMEEKVAKAEAMKVAAVAARAAK